MLDVERWALDVCCEIVISQKSIRAFRRTLLRWYLRHGRNLPWRHTHDPYAILVSEFMLQQTQVATVVPYYNDWLRRFPNFATLADAPENDVLHAWQGLGYYARARNLHAAAKLVQDRHGGAFPIDPNAIQNLPGIGRYTAHAIATFAFDCAVPVVEANIARLLCRLFNITLPIDSSAGREKLWQCAAMLVPKENAARFNSALMDLGALICTARTPKCMVCPLKKFCRAKNPRLLPIKRPRSKIKTVVEDHTFIVRQNKILLERSFGRWRNLWILPAISTHPPLRQLDGLKPSRLRRPIHVAQFPFTNHRVTLRVFRQASHKIDRQTQRWFSRRELSFVPIPSPHRRALVALLH